MSVLFSLHRFQLDLIGQTSVSGNPPYIPLAEERGYDG